MIQKKIKTDVKNTTEELNSQLAQTRNDLAKTSLECKLT